MNISKSSALKNEFQIQPIPQLVPIDRFFDGNDDDSSIGCNLQSHPGMNLFRDILVGLLKRPDVDAMYAQIAELDPGETSWSFCDTVLVVGRVDISLLQTLVAPLKPDEVRAAANEISQRNSALQNGCVSVIWWD